VEVTYRLTGRTFTQFVSLGDGIDETC